MGSAIGQLTTTDQDAGDTYSYEFDNSVVNDNSSFSLLSSGLLTVNELFDFEVRDSFLISVKTIDSEGLSFVKQFDIVVVDENEAPFTLSGDSLFVYENMIFGSLCGVLASEDQDNGDILSYSLVSGQGSADNVNFEIQGNQIKAAVEFNYEVKSTYTIRVRATDVAGLFIESAFQISILDTNEVPEDIQLSVMDINENRPDSAIVGAITTTDQDVYDVFSYSLTTGAGDDDDQFFHIEGDLLKIIPTADYETKASYRIRIKSTDLAGLYFEKEFEILVSDLNEKPEIDVMDYQISEAAAIGDEVGKMQVYDDDSDQSLTYVVFSSNVPFAINPSTGMISVDRKIDYETQNIYQVLFMAIDNGFPQLSDTALIQIEILDAIEEDETLPTADFVSPNNDGKNDFWKVKNVYLYQDYSLVIVDQNGQIVYEIESGYNNDWDAHMDGNPLPNGNYYYMFRDPISAREFKGFITVVK